MAALRKSGRVVQIISVCRSEQVSELSGAGQTLIHNVHVILPLVAQTPANQNSRLWHGLCKDLSQIRKNRVTTRLWNRIESKGKA